MKWARLIAIAPAVWSAAAIAQSVEQSVNGLETCFRAARLADTICEKQPDPKPRLDCFEKTRAAQLECLAHVLPDETTPSMKPSRAAPPAFRPAPPPKAAEKASPKETGSTAPAQAAVDKNPTADKSSKDTPSADAKPSAQPAAPDTSATDNAPTAAVRPDTQTTAKVAPPPESAKAPPPLEDAKAAPLLDDAMTAPLSDKKWTVSETASPVDYSPLVTAILLPEQQVGDGPTGLTIRCRAKRTELSLQFQGDPNAPKAGEVLIDYQIDDQPSIKQRWSWSANGKIATYKDDPVPVLQSLPEGARLKLWASDVGAQQGSTFKLVDLDSIRRKVAAACKWPPQQARTSSEKR